MKLSPSVFRSLIFLFFSLSVVTMQAQEPKRVIPDSIRISLLTCASGEEIYSLFGHTAIRYENYTRGIDAVFNYGIFNFNAADNQDDHQHEKQRHKHFGYTFDTFVHAEDQDAGSDRQEKGLIKNGRNRSADGFKEGLFQHR